jgi:septal ring factor EnvC (AmiA/AmiB activator)
MNDMTAYATKQDVEDIVEKAVDKAVTDLSGVIASFAQQVDERFNQNEAHLYRIDNRLADIESRLDKLEAAHQRLLNTIDTFVDRLDRYEIETGARDSQFDRLLTWARQVSEKTGIPLKDL